MSCNFKSHSPSPLSGRVQLSSSERVKQTIVAKDQRSASGLFKRLLTLKLTRKASPSKASTVIPRPSTHFYGPSLYEQGHDMSSSSITTRSHSISPTDALVQRVSQSLSLQGIQRRHTRSDSFSSDSSTSSGDTPSSCSGSSSGASTPCSSGLFTPPATPPQTPSKKKGSKLESVHSISYEKPPLVTVEPESVFLTNPALAPSVAKPAKHPIITYRRATPSQTITPAPFVESTGLIDISCQPLRRPLNRPARSKASLLHAALRNKEISSPSQPTQQSHHTSPSLETPVFKLPPLPRYNPFIRQRAESLSSLDRSSVISSTLAPTPFLTRTVSAPTTRQARGKRTSSELLYF